MPSEQQTNAEKPEKANPEKKAVGEKGMREAGPRGGFRGVVPPGQHKRMASGEQAELASTLAIAIRVGEEGFEPSRPFGHTDLNRARLPFRHPPGRGKKG